MEGERIREGKELSGRKDEMVAVGREENERSMEKTFRKEEEG